MNTKLSTAFALSAILACSVTFAQTQSPSSSRSGQSHDSTQSQQTSEPAEATKQELKVSEQQLHNNVTDANKASKIIGMEVRNTTNERIGKVKDIAIDTQTGKVGYAVLSVGGTFFGGGKLVAIPLDALTPQPGQRHFVIDADKDRLASAAGFSDEAWPALDSTQGNKTVGLSSSTVETEEERDAKDRAQKNRHDSLDEKRQRDAEQETQKKTGTDQPKRQP